MKRFQAPAWHVAPFAVFPYMLICYLSSVLSLTRIPRPLHCAFGHLFSSSERSSSHICMCISYLFFKAKTTCPSNMRLPSFSQLEVISLPKIYVALYFNLIDDYQWRSCRMWYLYFFLCQSFAQWYIFCKLIFSSLQTGAVKIYFKE